MTSPGILRSKKLSPVELTNLFLQRIKRLNPVLNAYVTVTEERACADAKTAEKEISRGRYRGPLHGIPFSIKDNLATRRNPHDRRIESAGRVGAGP